MCVYVCTNIYINKFTFLYLYPCQYIDIYIYKNVCIYMYICVSVTVREQNTYIYMYIRVCIHVYMCMHNCIPICKYK